MGTQQSNKNYTQAILDSINIMVDRALSTAKFDKTVSASIVSCMDAATGKYKVQYQDGTYQATAENTDIKYSDGANVYMLVPQGDFTKPKKILGEVSTSTSSDTKTTEEAIVNYEKVGSNIVSMTDEVGISSYNCDIPNYGVKTLYIKDGTENVLTINDTAFSSAAAKEDCQFFELGAYFKTNLETQHQSQGEYALLITLAYENEKKQLLTQTYKLDINSMMGNPYQYKDWSYQKTMLNLPVGTFKYVESIIFAAYNFDPQLAEPQTPNIFVKDIQVTGMASTASPYFNTYTIKINGSKGLEFSNSITTTKLTPQVEYQDRKVDIKNANIFWFRENSNVTTAHRHYLQYGGKGWACLNKSHQVTAEDGKTITTMFTSQNSLEVNRNKEFMPASMKYKCVIILTTGVMISKEFDITDRDYHHKMSMTASKKSFTNGFGSTTLKVKIVDKDGKDIAWTDENGKIRNIRYYWHTESAAGAVENIYYYTDSGLTNTIESLKSISIAPETNFTNYEIHTTSKNLKTLINDGINKKIFSKDLDFYDSYFEGEEDPEISESQKNALKDFNTLIEKEVFTDYLGAKLQSLNNNKALKDTTYQEVKTLIDKFNNKYTIAYLHDDTFFELPGSIVNGTVNYICTCWAEDANGSYTIYLGSTEVQLKNTYETQSSAKTWSTVIVNGDQIFKYDMQGRSPVEQTAGNPKPQTVLALKFNVFDEEGVQIDDAKIVPNYDDAKGTVAIDEWSWYVPSEDTLIDIPADFKDKEKIDAHGFYQIDNVKELPFSIANNFDDKKNQNRIKLRVKYGEDLSTNQPKYVWGYTNLVFTKDGSNGTNGTEYFCKVSPNIANGSVAEWPAIIIRDEEMQLNFTPQDTKNAAAPGQWFKAELFNNINKVNINDVVVNWSVLHNDYIGTADDDPDKPTIRTTGAHFYYSETGQFNFHNRSVIDGINHPSSIIQAEIEYQPEKDAATNVATQSNEKRKIYGSTTLDTIILYDDNYTARIKPSSGFNEVIYNASGMEPSFPNREFEVQVFKKKKDSTEFNYKDNLANNTGRNNNTGVPFKCVFSVYGPNKMFTLSGNPLDDEANVQDMTDEELAKNFPTNICRVSAKENYSGLETNCGLRVDIYKYNSKGSGFTTTNQYPSQSLIATIFHPIHLILNKYANAALNDWNGNSIEIKDGEGIILAPQMGAGFKEEDNTFTGMVMGTSVANDGTSFNAETGLMGFKGGVRTIFLDAESGKAEFGRAGRGQIILDPGDYDPNTHAFADNVDAVIKGGNYSAEAGTGMQINLSDPNIHFGSGKFFVNNQGQLYANDGAIGPWIFDSYGLAKAGDGLESDFIEEYFGDYTGTTPNESTIPEVINESDEPPNDSEVEEEADDDNTDVVDKPDFQDTENPSEGPNRTFYGEEPTLPYQIGDLWIHPPTGTGIEVGGIISKCIANPSQLAYDNNKYDPNDWAEHCTYSTISAVKTAYEKLDEEYKNYLKSEASVTDSYIGQYLKAGGTATIDGDYVMAPIIGGGYLSIQGTPEDNITRKVLIDPLKKTNTDYIFQIHGPVNGEGGIVMGVQDDGSATFRGDIYAANGYLATWSIENDAIYNEGIEESVSNNTSSESSSSSDLDDSVDNTQDTPQDEEDIGKDETETEDEDDESAGDDSANEGEV